MGNFRRNRLESIVTKRRGFLISYSKFIRSLVDLLPTADELVGVRDQLGYMPGWEKYVLPQVEERRRELLNNLKGCGRRCKPERFPGKAEWIAAIKKEANIPNYMIDFLSSELSLNEAKRSARPVGSGWLAQESAGLAVTGIKHSNAVKFAKRSRVEP